MVALAALAAALAILAAIVGWHPSAFVTEGCAALRHAGPCAFFLAMALLPAIGFPIAPFNIAAGPAFAQSLGLVEVLALASLAIATNVALAYLLARFGLRPPMVRLLAYLGYPIPAIPPGRSFAIALLVRATPGPPFFLQSCMLGLAGIPFLPYMAASWSVATAYASAMIVGGDALVRGNLRTAIFCLCALAALAAGFRLLRREKPRGQSERAS